MKKVAKLIKAFKATGQEESEKIELDNLDWAKLVLVDSHDGLGTIEVMVENEHGSLFNVTELSNTELNIFLDNL